MALKCKLIIVEGLPGSGKSTIAQFIAHQFKKNKIEAQWYCEVGLQHPLDFCGEACLIEEENNELLNKYYEYRNILETEGYKAHNNYFYKFVEIQRKYKEILPRELIEELESFDVENSNVNNYMELKAKKWKEYNELFGVKEEVIVIESSLLQGPIVTLLLEDKPKEEIKNYVEELLSYVMESNPTLVYFHQENVEMAIKQVFNSRGEGFADYVVKMICESKYGKNRGLSGVEGAITFFNEYKDIGDELYLHFNINKLDIENSEGKWQSYKEKILNKLELEYIGDKFLSEDILEQYVGDYFNFEIKRELSIKLEDGNLFFYTNKYYKERLIPVYDNSFHIEASTLDIVFLKNESNKVDRFVIGGRDTAASFGKVGLVFNRLK